jgi:hypothetical protein
VTAAEQVLAELSRWESNYVDVTALRDRAKQAERDKEVLAEKLALLERRIQVGRGYFKCLQLLGLRGWTHRNLQSQYGRGGDITWCCP